MNTKPNLYASQPRLQEILHAGLPQKRKAVPNFYRPWRPVYQFILTPGQLGPRGPRYPLVSWPPGAKISWGILAPTLGILAPGGQDTLVEVSWTPPFFFSGNFNNLTILFFYYRIICLEWFAVVVSAWVFWPTLRSTFWNFLWMAQIFLGLVVDYYSYFI